MNHSYVMVNRKPPIKGERRIINGREQVHILSDKGWWYWKYVPEPVVLPTTTEDWLNMPSYTRYRLRKYDGVDVPHFKPGPIVGITHHSVESVELRAAKLRTGSMFYCEVCGSEFWRTTSQMLRGDARFCSRTCYGKSQQGIQKPDWVRAKWRDGRRKRINTTAIGREWQSTEYQEWRTKVFTRDGYTCQKCGVKSSQGTTVYLNAHHIRPYAICPELKLDINNGITLCSDCHKLEPKVVVMYA